MMINEDLLGVPYKWAGVLPEGLDCFGLMVEVRRRCGIATPNLQWAYKEEDQFDRSTIKELAAKYFVETIHKAGAFTLYPSTKGPALITSDGVSAFYISPRLRVAAVPIHDLGEVKWRI